MLSSWKLPGCLPRSLRDQLHASALFVITVARSPQLYLDRAWSASRAFLFSVTFISLVLSKFFHVCVHLKSLTPPSLLVWGPTFFLTDVLLILIARGLARSFQWRSCRDVAAGVTVLFRYAFVESTR